MTDWADEVTDFLAGVSVCAGETHYIAAALRKAKADAFIEAAEACMRESRSIPTGTKNIQQVLAEGFLAAASKLHPTE